MVTGKYIKVIGFTFDGLEGLSIVADSNVKDYIEAGKYAEKNKEDNVIFVSIPCEYTYANNNEI